MRYDRAIDWEPPSDRQRITVIDSHTGGEPFRVVVGGLPEIPGITMLERRKYAAANLDHLRKAMMLEPRGHANMYGGWLGPAVRPDSDLSVLFIHNEGFSTMCGHGIIALTKVLIDTGMIDARPELRIDTPAGQILARPTLVDGSVAEVAFTNVASFVSKLDARVDVPGMGEVVYDLAFGGAFYAYLTAESIGVGLDDAAGLIRAGTAIKQAIMSGTEIPHPADRDLGFLYGVIFRGPAKDPANHSRNVCVFADGEVDRSPTGTGVSGLLAILQARADRGVDQEIAVEGITGSVFRGRILSINTSTTPVTVVPEIIGSAHILGRSEYWIDPSDALGRGFLIR